MLSIEIVTTTQSTIELSATNTIATQIASIPIHQQNDTANRRQGGQQTRQQQQRQRQPQQHTALPWQQQGQHRQRRQPLQQNQGQQGIQQLYQVQRQQQHQQRQQQQQQRQRQRERRQQRYEQWQDRVWQRELERQNQRERQRYADRWLRPDLYHVLLMEETQDVLLEAYDWEKMDDQYKWEQEQVQEFELFAASEQQRLIQDETDQAYQIDTTANIQAEEQNDNNLQQLKQKELLEEIHFLNLQLQEP